MTLEDFARIVKLMREQQRRFFTGDKGVIAQSKDCERRVDAAVSAILNPQPSLFDPLEKVAGRPERPPPGSGGES